jgi:hypothetical protein
MSRSATGRGRRSAAAVACLLGSIALAACGSGTPAAAGTPAAPTASIARPTAAASSVPAPSLAVSAAPSVHASAAADLPRNGRIEVGLAGYAVTLPKNWFRVDLTKEDLEAFAKAGSGSLGPGTTDQLASQLTALVSSGISLFAYRFADADSRIGTNLNVIVLPSLGMDLATLENLNIGQLQGIVGKDVKIAHEREKLPAGDALRIAYTVPASTRTNGQVIALIQHLVLASDKQLILTCTAPGGIDKIADECDGIAKSVEFL